MKSTLPEIVEIQSEIDSELNASPHIRAPLVEILKRLKVVKSAINSAIKKRDATSNCDSISFAINENGMFYYRCITCGLIEENDEVLTELGEQVMAELKESGYTNLRFIYSEFPF